MYTCETLAEDDKYVQVRLHKTKFWAKYWRVCNDGESCSIPIHVDVEVPVDKIRTVGGGALVVKDDLVQSLME